MESRGPAVPDRELAGIDPHIRAAIGIRVLEPPLGDDAQRVHFSWPDVREMVVSGRAVETSLDRFFVGEVDGEFAGSMMYAAPRDTRDVAALEFVWTEPQHRRKGVATALLHAALADFRAGGGRAMYLCTTNPHAFALYAKAGFRSLAGDGMRYLAPGQEDFDRTYFAYAGSARVRAGAWGDLARAAALYNQPGPDWLIKDYHAPRRVFRDVRYESHYIRVWKPASEGRGALVVLENPLRRVVGIAATVEMESYYEQHVHLLDFFACPAYLDQVPGLLAAAVERAAAAGAEVVQACVASVDGDKQRLLRQAGFREEARLPRRLRSEGIGTAASDGAGGSNGSDDGGERIDLLVYGRHLPRRPFPAHPPETYYGARRPFHR
jgi:ribosomal protein S18 acetylase RimI-like enzyme